MDGYIKLHRKMLDWEWYQDGNTFRVFMHLLIKACFKETKYKGIVIPRGSYVISSSGLAEELGITRQSARTALNHLKSTNEITIKSTNRFTVITIVNYCIYQGEDSSSNQQTNQPANHQLTNNQPATNQPSEEESKKVRKKEKKIQKEKTLLAEFVSMTNDEYTSLVAELGEEGVKHCIEILDNYKGASGKPYKSDYRAIKSWVVGEYKKRGKGESDKEKSFRLDDVGDLLEFSPPPE